MSDSIDGGPAFPVVRDKDRDVFESGMSLRDWYAGMALQGLVAAAAFNQKAEDMIKNAGLNPKTDTDEFIAMLANDVADAMIAERNTKATAPQKLSDRTRLADRVRKWCTERELTQETTENVIRALDNLGMLR